MCRSLKNPDTTTAMDDVGWQASKRGEVPGAAARFSATWRARAQRGEVALAAGLTSFQRGGGQIALFVDRCPAARPSMVATLPCRPFEPPVPKPASPAGERWRTSLAQPLGLPKPSVGHEDREAYSLSTVPRPKRPDSARNRLTLVP